jgi:hypothetical protein
MYLSKQWHESRIISGIAILALALMLLLVTKGHFAIDSHSGDFHVGQGNQDNNGGFGMVVIPIFYVEAVLVAFWGWLAAGIGAGKNLGDESGSFLFTRPRRRAWFLWNDWGYAMAQIALIILLSNLMIGSLLAHFLVAAHWPGSLLLRPDGAPIPVFIIMLLISIGVLLFAGLIYGVTYLSTLLIQRSAGVMLGAGILVGYEILRGLMHHYFPSVHLPDLILGLFAFPHYSFNGLSDHLGIAIATRTVVMLLFPLAAQVVLERSEI